MTRSYGLRVAVHGASVRPSLMRLLADAPSIHPASLAVAAPGLPRLLVGHSPGKLNVAIALVSASQEGGAAAHRIHDLRHTFASLLLQQADRGFGRRTEVLCEGWRPRLT